ncbi:MAG: transcriptional regulator MntR [Phycisphaerales bacterium]|nr:MAG: transcriptional regulator MntR [Phycisphaerales bacterium]
MTITEPTPRAEAADVVRRRRRAHSTTEGFRQVRLDHAVEMAEDYVELIDDLIARHGEARLVDIAEHMGVSHVTANKTVARLLRDGLVQKRPYRAIFLTGEGKKLAEASRRKHIVVVEFLCALGVPEDQARIDAEGIEHHISDVTLSAMSRFVLASRPESGS